MLLHEKLDNYELILGSRSPRRRELIANCGLKFTLADSYEVEELYPPTLGATDVPLFLSQLKSKAYPVALTERQILITADTVVILGDKVLGKPTDRSNAVEILSALSGQSHSVVTGVTLRGVTKSHSFSVETKVWFRALTVEEIEYYVDTFRPYDKAGAYGIQEWIGYVAIERIEGSFYNVMGLPIQQLYKNLNIFISE